MKFCINLNQLVTPKLKRIPYVPNPPIETEEEAETEEVEQTDQMETSKEKGE